SVRRTTGATCEAAATVAAHGVGVGDAALAAGAAGAGTSGPTGGVPDRDVGVIVLLLVGLLVAVALCGVHRPLGAGSEVVAAADAAGAAEDTRRAAVRGGDVAGVG